jgi:hypothetical protein
MRSTSLTADGASDADIGARNASPTPRSCSAFRSASVRSKPSSVRAVWSCRTRARFSASVRPSASAVARLCASCQAVTPTTTAHSSAHSAT